MESTKNSFITDLLTADKWTMFLIFVFPYILEYIIPENLEYLLTPILGLLAVNIWFLWILIIGIELNKRLPDFLVKESKYFNFGMVYLLVGFTLLMINSYWISAKINPVIVLILIILGLITLVYCIYFTSRSLKELEKKRNVSPSEYISIGFLLIFIFIGIWYIQPRIRNVILNPDYKEGVK